MRSRINRFVLQHSEKKTIGLASYIDASGALSQEGQDKAVIAIKKFVKGRQINSKGKHMPFSDADKTMDSQWLLLSKYQSILNV